MAWNFTPRLSQPRKPAWKWKLWWRLLPRPSRSTTCAKPWTKGWRSPTSTWLKKPAERAAISIPTKAGRPRRRDRRATGSAGRRRGRIHRQTVPGERPCAHQKKSGGPPASRKNAEARHAPRHYSRPPGRNEHDRFAAIAGDGPEILPPGGAQRQRTGRAVFRLGAVPRRENWQHRGRRRGVQSHFVERRRV